MDSERLHYQPLDAALLDDFHALVEDEHVRRYLLDGELFPRAWSADRVRDSEVLFEQRGVGLWLSRLRDTNDVLGFCGFLVFPSMHAEPQIVYAMPERFTRRGYASEMARACINEARRHPGFETIVASVDEVNAGSMRILESLGFQRTSTLPGSFGNMFLLELRGGKPIPPLRSRAGKGQGRGPE